MRDVCGRHRVIGNACGKSKGSRLLRSAIAVVLASLAGLAVADDATLARAKNCLNCHAVDEKIVGPAFRSVAARYANDRGAEARLAGKIREGGSGAWGVVPMPANEVTAAEARQLAHWVLMQK